MFTVLLGYMIAYGVLLTGHYQTRILKVFLLFNGFKLSIQEFCNTLGIVVSKLHNSTTHGCYHAVFRVEMEDVRHLQPFARIKFDHVLPHILVDEG